MGINWLVQGIECRKAPESLPDEGGKAREGYGRSAGAYLEGQRIGTNGRPRGARLSNGRPRGPEALRVFRRTGVGGHQWLYGDARHAAGTPLGPLGVIGSMSMATRKAHWDKPIWVTEGGAELPVLNIAISTALMIREPDRFSLDRLLGIRLPAWVGPVGLVGVILTVLYAELGADEAPEQDMAQEEAEDETREELAGP